MKGQVSLFFMYRAFGGGTTSYTVHLFEGFRRAGYDVKIYRVNARGEYKERPFSKYAGVTYRNIDPVTALKIAKTTPSLLTAPCNSKFLEFDPEIIGKLMKAGMRIVIHDPNEFEIYDHLNNRNSITRPFCIRPAMRNFFPKAIFIPHPYVREFTNKVTDRFTWRRDYLAVSIARVTFVKRTELILAANRLLPKKAKVVLRGAENRLYTRHKLQKLYPEYEQGNTGFPMVWGASARECARARFAVDFTWFPDDGGGSQYSFMEAWDAGTVNIIHKDWLRYPGEMKDGVNCIAVDTPAHLAAILKRAMKGPLSTNKSTDLELNIVRNGWRLLHERHDPVNVANAYYKEMIK